MNNIKTDPKFSHNTHTKVWNVYVISARKDCRRIGAKGMRLKNDRREADYKADSVFALVRVQECINAARNLVTSVGVNLPEGFSGIPTSPIADAIRTIRQILRI